MRKWFRRLCFFLLALLALKGLGTFLGDEGVGQERIAIVDITGTIWTSEETLEELRDLKKNDSVKGVVVRINSPGGTVAASQEIHDALKLLKTGKPVVASLGTVAASGGLYIAMGSDHIIADPGTITGSVGVLMEHMHFGTLLNRLGIGTETLQSGEFKTILSYHKPVQPEGRKMLNEMLTEVHGQFKEAIRLSRNLTEAEVERLADGRVFTGAKAQELKLIDRLGSLDAAIAWAAELAGISGEPHLLKKGKDSFWVWKSLRGTFEAFVSGPKICYLYQ